MYFSYKSDAVSIVNEATALYTFTSVPTLFAYVTFIPDGISVIPAFSATVTSTDFSVPSYLTVFPLNSTFPVKSYIPFSTSTSTSIPLTFILPSSDEYFNVNVCIPISPTDVVKGSSKLYPFVNVISAKVCPYLAFKPVGTSSSPFTSNVGSNNKILSSIISSVFPPLFPPLYVSVEK